MAAKNTIPALRLVLGGANSGKSRHAEQLIAAADRPRRYIATAQAWDDEMRAKIAQHRLQRGPDWTTVEAPLDLTEALAAAQPEEIVLLDCVTLWLSNLMMAERDIQGACAALCTGLAHAPCTVIVVSNEVGQGITPDNAMARAFVKHQGHLNQAIVKLAPEVIFVTAGIAQKLKSVP